MLIADGTNARMDRIAFVLTMMKTGEQHVIVTDRNGMFHSGGKTNPHSQRTNANDALLEKYQDEDAVIPADETDQKQVSGSAKARRDPKHRSGMISELFHTESTGWRNSAVRTTPAIRFWT